MIVNWESLLTVVLVSAVATVAIVALVSLAVLGWSARSVHPLTTVGPALLPRRAGTAIAAVALVASVAIVLFGLWEIVS